MSTTAHSSAAVPETLRRDAVAPGHHEYDALRSTYSTVGAPALILRPRSVGDVVDAIELARKDPRPLAVRSGGHGPASTNDGGIVVDVSRLDDVTVLDPGRRLVRVGAGARWAGVARELAPAGWAISSGDHGNVGVGGLATGGGVGWLTRSYGLTIDHARAATVVLADGSVVAADEDHEAELFWGLRGAGGSLGVVTSFDFVAAPVREVGITRLRIQVDPDGFALSHWGAVMASAPRDLTSFVTVMPSREGWVAEIAAVVSGRTHLTRELTAPLTGIGRVLDARSEITTYAALLPEGHLHANVGQQPAVAANGLAEELTPELAGRVMAALRDLGGAAVQLRSLGGAVHDIARSAMAFSHRHQHVMVVLAAFPPTDINELDRVWADIEPETEGSYLNFDSRPHTARAVARAFPGAVGTRLRRLQKTVDPDGVFLPSQ